MSECVCVCVCVSDSLQESSQTLDVFRIKFLSLQVSCFSSHSMGITSHAALCRRLQYLNALILAPLPKLPYPVVCKTHLFAPKLNTIVWVHLYMGMKLLLFQNNLVPENQGKIEGASLLGCDLYTGEYGSWQRVLTCTGTQCELCLTLIVLGGGRLGQSL